LGQLVCTPTRPQCTACPIADFCEAYAAKTQDIAPAPKIRKSTKDVQLRLTIPLVKNQVGLVDRSGDANFLRGIKGFITGDDKDADTGATFVGTIKHTITNHKITASVYVLRANALPNSIKTANIEYKKRNEVEENLISNLDRKAWLLYLARTK